MRKYIFPVLILVLILASGCTETAPVPGQADETNPIGQTDLPGATRQPQVDQEPENVPVTDIILNTNSLQLNVNDTYQLVAELLPVDASEDLNWTSSAPETASVSSQGLVTARGNGTAEITVSAVDSGTTAFVAVTVTTPVTGISLAPARLQLKPGQTTQLTALFTPEAASDRELTWTTTNPKVAEVSASGQVTATGNGTAAILVKTKSGNITASAPVNVVTPVTGVSLNKSSLNLKFGQSAQLSAAVSPGSASDNGVAWSTSNNKVATVSSSGKVTAQGKGKAVITVTTRDGGIQASAAVTVTEPDKTAGANESLMLELVNQERQDAGLQPLIFNMKLTEVARVKSQDMIDNDYFAHDSPVYGSPFEMMKQFGITYRYAAENLALHPSVESAHQGLMNSDGHRANILNPKLTEIGIGIIRNSNGQYYVTQMFIGF